jgi:anthranilate phosphoribosyltransferase
MTEPAILAREARLADPDAAYRMLAEAHRDLDERDSAALNARLVLILANQIGDLPVLREAVALARQAR